MAPRHVVVDGSNVATEGRSTPSLAQLDQAVREFLTENPTDIVSVVVDASFGHRIDPSEQTMFEEAEAAGEVVSPPAGAIGRGDAFLLRIAEKTGATVLSNDSFQEFHGEHGWLFDKGRLVGGKPVPGVGWIFTPRTPVRGPKSREAVKEAKRGKKGEVESGMPGLDLAAERARGKKGKRSVDRAIAVATEEAVAPKENKRRRRRKGGEPPSEPVNEPLSFITLIAAHPLGSEVTGTVDAFSSHGAFVLVDGARCYLPLAAMGAPPPKSAREVLGRGETRAFVVQALDPLRRGVELALPGFAKVAGTPTDETVEAEITGEAAAGVAPVPLPVVEPVKRAQKAAVMEGAATKVTEKAPSKRAVGQKVAGAKRAVGKKAAAPKKAPAPRKAAALTQPPAPKRAPVKKAAMAKKEPAPKKAQVPKKAPAREKAPASAKKGSAKKAPARKTPVPAKQAAPAKTIASVNQAAPGREAARAKQAPAAKAAARAAKGAPRRGPTPGGAVA
ncbi:MAG TPA: hypothetical protein VLL25_15970 [Acidimicrobiales bacterium]|nr:hypothetical protein [Acidimicrobiales bacterium]